MHRIQPIHPTSLSRKRHQLIGKELDLLLLAGCSCLLTLLYHPVAEALQANQVAASAQSPIAIQVNQTPANSSSLIHLALPPAREGIQDDDESAA